MTLAVMKVFYKKKNANVVKYRTYKNFDNEAFMNEVKYRISHIDTQDLNANFDVFKNVTFNTFEKHAPLKQRHIRANQAPFMNKKISKEIMKRSRLKNAFLKSKTEIDRLEYNRQRNLCVSLIR